MSISGTSAARNCDPAHMVTVLSGFVDTATRDGIGMREFERGLFDRLLQVGFRLTEEFLQRQGNGDCGDTYETSGKTLYRSEAPQRRVLRTIFGEHADECFVDRVRRHANSAIAARLVDDRLGMAPDRYSPLLQEFFMMFCTELAFRPGAEAFDTIFGQQLSVDTLEHLSRTMGAEAGEFMETLPAPAADEEGEFLVMSADGKGIPMVRADAVRLRACDPRPDRPGNRRMASVAAVYSVDPFVRTADQIIAALFSSESAEQPDAPPRPQPQHKRYTARFGQVLPDLETPATGTQLAMVWAGSEVERRLQPGQKLVQIMDGQHSLWDEADAGLSVPEADTVEILDLLHVCTYVWTAAKALHAAREDQEVFVKDKLVALLEGRVVSVIRSLRHLATRRGLRGFKRDDINRVCGYFESHRSRMQYDEYLAAGYPIATGVIEGACRHLVKDRMERSGMKWTKPGAQGLLHLRCLRASGLWEQFHLQRSARSPELQLSS